MRVLLLPAIVVFAFSAPPAAQQAPPNTVRIDGAERPELVPDHWIWRATFLKLNAIKQQKGEDALAFDLPLVKSDADALYKEAARQASRDAECQAQVVARRKELAQEQARPDAVARAVNDITLECRTRDLDAADRVLDGLTDDGRLTFTAWLEKRRRSIVIFVPASDLDTFKLPR